MSGIVAVTGALAGGAAVTAGATISVQPSASLAGAGGVSVGQSDKGGGVIVTGAILFPGKPPNPLGAKVELNLNGAWTDITPYVMLRDTIQITNMGRTDEAATISASQLAITLKNNDSRFTPLNSGSPYYPYIQRNTQIRLSLHAVSATGVQYSGYRFNGEVSSWPMAQNTSGTDNYAQITGSGIWRRISQNQANIGSAYTRYLNKLTGLDVPASAWSMEDGSGKNFAITAGGGGSAGWTSPGSTVAPSFQSDGTSFPGADALPALNGARIAAPVSSAATPTSNVTRFALSVPATGDSTATTTALVSETDSTGTVAKFRSYLATNGKLSFQGLNSGGSVLFSSAANTNIHGVPVLVSLELTPSGPNIKWTVSITKPGATAVLEAHSGTISGSINTVSQVKLNPSGALSDTVAGQLGVWYDVPSVVTAAQALGGWAGEYAVARFARLCREENITATTIGVNSAQMGPQSDGTLAATFQTIEDTDGGLLFEPRDAFGLGYRTLASMTNQSAAVSLDYGNGQLGTTLTTAYDDQLLRNQWAVTNTDGYVALATLSTGSTSTQPPPNGAGLYASTASTNAYLDSQVNAIAQHRLFMGTVDDARFPQISVNLARPQAAGLLASVAGIRVGDYLQVTDVASTIDPNAIHQLSYGYAETIGHNQWTIVFNCIPEQPFETAYTPSGAFSVIQGTNAAPAGSVSGASIASGAIAPTSVSTAISARGIGGSTSFVASSPPYDWTFGLALTPGAVNYFICTQEQAQAITAADTFTNSSGYGGPFTVTTVNLDPANPGYADVFFTPDASSAMSSGTVYGGKQGDVWVNSAAGNQLLQWNNGAWQAVPFGTGAISASAITTTLLAANIVYAGIVDGTEIDGSVFRAKNSFGATIATINKSSGTILLYNDTSSASQGSLAAALSQYAGTDEFSNSYGPGVTVATGNSTPSQIAGQAIMYGDGNGDIHVVDGQDAAVYAVQNNIQAVGSDINNIGNGYVTIFAQDVSHSSTGGSRNYRVRGVAWLHANQTAGQFYSRWSGPASSNGKINWLYTGGNTGSWTPGYTGSAIQAAAGFTMTSGAIYTLMFEGVIGINNTGTFTIQMQTDSGDTFNVLDWSYFEVAPL